MSESGQRPSRFVGSWRLEPPSLKTTRISGLGCIGITASAVVVLVLAFHHLGVAGGGAAIAVVIGIAVAILWLWQRRDAARDRANPVTFRHGRLGELRWKTGLPGWTLTAEGPDGPVCVCIYAGNRDEPPDERLLELIAQPIGDLQRLVPVALTFLVTEARRANHDVKPEQFTLRVVEIYGYSEGEYYLIFDRKRWEMPWLVEFVGGEPKACGICD